MESQNIYWKFKVDIVKSCFASLRFIRTCMFIELKIVSISITATLLIVTYRSPCRFYLEISILIGMD